MKKRWIKYNLILPFNKTCELYRFVCERNFILTTYNDFWVFIYIPFNHKSQLISSCMAWHTKYIVVSTHPPATKSWTIMIIKLHLHGKTCGNLNWNVQVWYCDCIHVFWFIMHLLRTRYLLVILHFDIHTCLHGFSSRSKSCTYCLSKSAAFRILSIWCIWIL